MNLLECSSNINVLNVSLYNLYTIGRSFCGVVVIVLPALAPILALVYSFCRITVLPVLTNVSLVTLETVTPVSGEVGIGVTVAEVGALLHGTGALQVGEGGVLELVGDVKAVDIHDVVQNTHINVVNLRHGQANDGVRLVGYDMSDFAVGVQGGQSSWVYVLTLVRVVFELPDTYEALQVKLGQVDGSVSCLGVVDDPFTLYGGGELLGEVRGLDDPFGVG